MVLSINKMSIVRGFEFFRFNISTENISVVDVGAAVIFVDFLCVSSKTTFYVFCFWLAFLDFLVVWSFIGF